VLVEPTTIANTGGTATKTGGQVVYSGVTSLSLNGVFSATYRNYLMVFNTVLTGAADPSLRYRVAGVDASGNDYVGQFARALNTTFLGSLSTQTLSNINVLGGTNNVYNATFYAPFETVGTQHYMTQGAENGIAILTNRHSLANSYDGFTILTASGSFAGSLRVYGYDNS
jgi:hypothetical protein